MLAAMQRELMHISRDALAGVLGVTGERGTRIEGIRCIDLRRHDERALYGSIPGKVLMHVASTLSCMPLCGPGPFMCSMQTWLMLHAAHAWVHVSGQGHARNRA